MLELLQTIMPGTTAPVGFWNRCAPTQGSRYWGAMRSIFTVYDNTMPSKFILLHPQDNVLICCQPAGAGETVTVGDATATLLQNVTTGHKIARQTVLKDDKIIRYGVSIGSAKQDIAIGEHVHLHNMKSDYIPPHTRYAMQKIGNRKQSESSTVQGFLRKDGRKGIRNALIVAYLVECAHHVARVIVTRSADPAVQLIGFPGCFPNDYALKIMQALGTHPNTGGMLLVSLGCEGFNREALARTIHASGRPVETL